MEAAFDYYGDPLPPPVPLPRDEISLRWVDGSPYVVFCGYTRDFGSGPALEKIKLRWADIPNEMIDLDDLKRLGAFDAYLAATRDSGDEV